MYDTARRVAFVKQRVRENTRRGQRREAISLSAFCLMLFTALAGAADALIVQGQTAAPAHEQTRHPRRDAGNGRSGRGSLASSHAGTRLPIAYKTPDSGRSPSVCDEKPFSKRCTPPERSFCSHTALLPLAIHQGLLRETALSAGKNPRHSAHPAYENSF